MSVSVKVIFLVDRQHNGSVSRFLYRVENSLGLTHVWTYQRRDGLSHYQNLTSLSAFGSILKDFCELISVSAKVILLVGHDETLHNLIEFGNSWGLRAY